MGHKIKLRKYHLEHRPDIRAMDDWIVGVLKAYVLGEEVVKPSVRIQCCTSRVELHVDGHVSLTRNPP